MEIKTDRFKMCKGKKLFYSNLQLTCGSKGLYIQTSDRRHLLQKDVFFRRMAYLRSKQAIKLLALQKCSSLARLLWECCCRLRPDQRRQLQREVTGRLCGLPPAAFSRFFAPCSLRCCSLWCKGLGRTEINSMRV